MKHNNYSISDAAKKLNIEAHVLRYWEEELGLDIPRKTWDTVITVKATLKLLSR